MIVVFALLAQSLFIVQRVAQTRNVVGQVTVQRGGAGEMIALVEGTPVQNGDVVRAGAKSSAEFNWQDGTRWKLLANSHLVIQKSLFNSLPGRLKKVVQFSYGLSTGYRAPLPGWHDIHASL